MKGTGIAWDFFLAQKLHKTVAEIQQMPQEEYELWQVWTEVSTVLTDLERRTEENRAK